MESAVISGLVQSRPHLTTLPREIRNQIYRYLIVSSKPIKVCYHDDSSKLCLRAGRQNKDISVEFLCHAVKGSELAHEAYEEFFRKNTFDCGGPGDLRRFLTTTTIHFNSQNNMVPINKTNKGCLKFEKEPWIRKVKVAICSNIFERKCSENLTHLLRCPNLHQVEITIFGLTNEEGKINPVDLTIEAIARVCKSVRTKVGGGLIVKVQKDWDNRAWALSIGFAMINNPGLEDVSWMWEEPSHGVIETVSKGSGTHKDNIQTLMSAGWAGKKGKVGAWAEHWARQHSEQ